ncbi:hypothetical protein NW072_04630 [Mycoplasmopsis felis]|uniref:hypothetical protein n=1 Tax=Mycoplasmopsis felis TaxID=33923 RepID=UPI0021AF1353|nr:hypothetical protein [Mycoplasmopsis felis]UWV79315.1 hypothetical protein NW072_04630 [Mycoplasmopsis felis]
MFNCETVILVSLARALKLSLIVWFTSVIESAIFISLVLNKSIFCSLILSISSILYALFNWFK